MDETAVREQVVTALRGAGAAFAFVFGSRARGDHRPDSDLDVAAWWAADAPGAWEISLPAGVDLLVLNGAPLELAGRVALEGQLLFDDDPPRRVEWTASMRKIWLDERARVRAANSDFAEQVKRGRH